MVDKNTDILWVASFGGHLIQLERLISLVDPHNYKIVTTSALYDAADYIVPEFSRDNVFRVIISFLKSLNVLIDCKPKLVVTTGAAPGLVFVIMAKLLNIKSIWIDSVANTKQLSMSGRIAKKFTNVYTQWEYVSNKEKVEWIGNVLECS